LLEYVFGKASRYVFNSFLLIFGALYAEISLRKSSISYSETFISPLIIFPFPVIPSPASISVSLAIAAKLFSDVILRSLLISSSLRILLSIPSGNPELAPAPNFFWPLIGLLDLPLL